LLEQYAGIPANEALPKAGTAANRALEIDGELAEAHTSLAFYYHASWRWEEAEKEFKRAISLNPKYATARHWYQIHLRTMGRLDKALEQITLALELDPLSPILQVNLASVYRSKGDFESAMTAGQKVAELDPNFSLAHETIGFVYIKQQKYAEAIEAFQKDVDHTRSSYALSTLGYGYAVAGMRDEALAILRELEEKYNRREALGQYPALVYAGLGDKDKAFEWIEKDFQARSGALDFVIATSRFDSIHSDPRFADLRRRMGLPN
jgi:serine/threonine-protein kinase